MEYGAPSQKTSAGALGPLWRLIVAVFLTLVVVLAEASPAFAIKNGYAGIVVDAKTGRTLYSYGADSPHYPASVTKVMTLYILFEEMEAGRFTLNSRLRVSAHASGAPPTKLYLKPGSTIPVKTAILAVVTRSANDVARVIAENISGTESKFAERMTRTARALGMTHTHYANASGLPNSRQLTTVRDQARLAMAMYQHFPQYAKYFSTRYFRYRGAVIGNHNHLLGRVKGVDGMKTGYTHASGFNLLTSARSGNRHIIVAAFGFPSSKGRDAKVTRLVRKYLPKARNGTLLANARIPSPSGAGYAVAVLPMPRLGSRVPGPVPAPAPDNVIQLAQNDVPSAENSTDLPDENDPQITLANTGVPVPAAAPEGPSPDPTAPVPAERAHASPPHPLVAPSAAKAATLVANADPRTTSPAAENSDDHTPVDLLGSWMNRTFDTIGRQAPSASSYQPTNVPLPPATIGASGNKGAVDLMTSGAARNASNTPGWIVQVGAPPSEDGAHTLLSKATSSIGDLSDFRGYIERFQKSGRVFYRARFSGFAGRDQAKGMCSQLRQASLSCIAMPG